MHPGDAADVPAPDREDSGKPEERILSYLMLRSLKQARYCREERRPLRAGLAQLHPLHLAHPALSRPHRPPPAPLLCFTRVPIRSGVPHPAERAAAMG